MNPQEPTSVNQLDPQVVNLAKAIRHVESGDNFNASGPSGERGAYQFTQPFWQGNAQKYLGDANAPLTPENQNKVAYYHLKELKDQGYNPGQIASLWNSGSPDHTNDNYRGVNAHGVAYDTPAYVQKVYAAYQQTKGISSQPQASPVVPDNSAPQGQDKGLIGNLTSGNILGADKNILDYGKKALDFAFPIAGDVYKDIQGKNDKTVLQQAGDAGLSALWFLPMGGLAEGAGTGLKALGLGADAAKAGGVLAAGLGSGYAGDVASKLSQGKTGLDVAKPGMGTVIGGGLAGAGLAGSALYNKFRGEQTAIDKVTQAYEDAAGATKSGIKGMSKTAGKGLDPNSEFLAHAGIPPETEEINGRRVFTTGQDSASQKTLQKRISDLSELRDQAIEKTPTEDLGNGMTLEHNAPTSNLEDLRKVAIQKAEQEFSGTARESAQAHINSEFDAYKNQYGQGGDEVSLADMNRIKKDLQGKTNYDATRPSIITQSNTMMANLAKTQVENDAEKAGIPAVKALNKIIQQHIDARDFLNRINGQTIKGGRLGGYLYKGIGASVGLAANHVFGGGLMGDIIGAAAGERAGGLASSFMQKLAVGGPTTAATLGRMAKEDPEVVQQFLEYLGRQGDKVAPMAIPTQESAGGLMGKLLNKSPGNKLLNAAR